MTSDTEGRPTFDIRRGFACLRLNRPEKHNHLKIEDISEIRNGLDQLDGRRDLRALVIHAEGPSFSSGFDLSQFRQDDITRHVRSFSDLCDRLETFRLPTICAVNGGVFGGATDLMLACDIRVGSPEARMRMPAGRLGLHFYHGGLRRYVDQLGASQTKRIFLTGQMLDSAEMLRIGALHEVVPGADLQSRALQIAGDIATGAPGPVQGMKASIHAIVQGADETLEIDARFETSLQCPSLREGLQALQDRRPPVFADS